MVRVDIEGVNKVRKRLRDGSLRVYYYHRATNFKLRGDPGSPEFIADYAAAEKFLRDRHAGSVNGLIRDYTLSPEFERLRESTRAEYRRMLTKVEAAFGTMPIGALEDPRVRQEFLAYRAKVARDSGEREADNRLSIISAMLSWGKENGIVFANYVAGFRRLHHADRSEMIWLPEHIAAFMRVAPIEMQRALILALHTGQRQGDLLRLTWSNYSDGWITLRQGKSQTGDKPGRKVEIPCTAALRAMLDAIPRDNAVILTTASGRPWKARYFKAQWTAASKAAGIADLHFHDLRGTAITMLSEASCTVPEIAAITGHSLKTVSTILDRYLARTRDLASNAVARFENAKATKFANQLQTSAAKSHKGEAK